MIRSLRVKNFNLQHSLCCGQFFRYREMGGFYYIYSREKLFKVRQDGNLFFYDGCTKKFLIQFFGLNDNYEEILQSINKDDHINAMINEYNGIRIIRQDPWECLVSFVCSSASNIKRIQGNMSCMAHLFGKPIKLGAVEGYTFPAPGELNTKIKQCKLGFREKYVVELNKIVTDVWLEKLRKKSYEKAKEELIKLPGVAEKIADCVLLYSLGFSHAFPVDVWMKRVLQELYFKNKNIPHKKLADFGRTYFGTYAGLAQQYLYHWRRQQ